MDPWAYCHYCEAYFELNCNSIMGSGAHKDCGSHEWEELSDKKYGTEKHPVHWLD